MQSIRQNIVLKTKAIFAPVSLAPIILLSVSFGWSCEALFTEGIPEGESFDQPLPALSRAQLLAFARGDEAFEKVFSVKEGLGPIFNQPSCESCHAGDGKGHPMTNLTKFGRTTLGGFDPMIRFGGPQLQNRSIPGVPSEELPPEINAVSVRSGPFVFGMGLLQAIPDSVLLAQADPEDANGDGIRGRPNYVTPPEWMPVPQKTYIGRFGRKEGVAFLLQQVVTAYHQDMGITSEFLPSENPHPQSGTLGDDVPDPEVSTSTVEDVVFYLRTLAPPRRGTQTTQTQRGEKVFEEIGCAGCHVPRLRTGPHPTIAALSNVDVPLYSDLLLHDMGPELADKFVEGTASGSEWRTTPLWGLRLLAQSLGGTPFYLHDGRTSDLIEVIRFHGGEAAAVRQRFFALPAGDREALLAFLCSL